MFQSRMFITTAARFLILIGIIVSVHGKAQNPDYRPVFVNINNQVDIFEGSSIDNCLTTITAKTYDGTLANKNINFLLKDDIPYFEINHNGCLKIKPGMTISKNNDNPTLPVVVIATDTRYPQLSHEITMNINFTSSDTNVNRKLIKVQSSHWFNNEDDIDDDDDDDNADKKNVIGIPETIDPSEPIMTVTNMTENVVNFTSLNDKHGIFRFENNRVYANKDKLNFANNNGIGMRDFDLIIVATNDQHQYQYQKIKIKTLRSRGSPPALEVHKKELLINEEADINGCICQLIASDPDSVISSTIYFEIIKPTNYFSIDERGCIELKERLDRECKISGHNCPPSQLKVGVFFEGHFLETVVPITVNITDVNDHAPELKMKHATVYERKKSKFIAKLIAIDKDLNETNGNSFKFEINHDSHYPDGDKFEIKNNTELYNIVPLHVTTEKTKYEISITIRDNGNPRNSNTSIFTVEVKKRNGLKFIQSKYVVFVSGTEEINTPVTKYFWVKNNSGPVDYKIIQTDPNNYFSVDKIYDSDMDIYYGQIVVNKKFKHPGDGSCDNLDVRASDKLSHDILPVRICYINANKPAIELNPLGNSYSGLKQIAKDSVECIATVHASGISITDNPIQYNISEASSERYLGSSTYSEEVVKSLFVKINKDNGCIQIQKYNGLYQNELMVIRAYYKYDDSPTPLLSRRTIRIRLVNSMEPLISEHFMKIRPVNLNNQMYNVTMTDAM